MEKQEIMNIIINTQKKELGFAEPVELKGSKIYMLKETYHGCRVEPDNEVWECPAVMVATTGDRVIFGKLTWDMKEYAHFEDASDMPWNDTDLMEFEEDEEAMQFEAEAAEAEAETFRSIRNTDAYRYRF